MRFLLILLLSLLPIGVTEAASVSLDPLTREAGASDTFLLTVRISNAEECINAGQIALSFDPKTLSVVSVSKGQSIFSLWVGDPIIDNKNGLVSFTGGIPGGYCGRIVGDPGLTNILGKVAFTAAADAKLGKLPKTTVVNFATSTEIYLNDGSGQKAALSRGSAKVTLTTDTGIPVNEWLTEVGEDTIAPELFSVELERIPGVLDGKYFISFSTTDKQSGIDHYEIRETDPMRFGFWREQEKPSHYLRTQSPYVLKDQTLGSTLFVKAIDTAGNERVVQFTPKTALSITKNIFTVLLQIIVVLVLIVFVGRIVRRRTEAQKLPPQ
jgi:hypothetical protein